MLVACRCQSCPALVGAALGLLALVLLLLQGPGKHSATTLCPTQLCSDGRHLEPLGFLLSPHLRFMRVTTLAKCDLIIQCSTSILAAAMLLLVLACLKRSVEQVSANLAHLHVPLICDRLLVSELCAVAFLPPPSRSREGVRRTSMAF